MQRRELRVRDCLFLRSGVGFESALGLERELNSAAGCSATFVLLWLESLVDEYLLFVTFVQIHRWRFFISFWSLAWRAFDFIFTYSYIRAFVHIIPPCICPRVIIRYTRLAIILMNRMPISCHCNHTSLHFQSAAYSACLNVIFIELNNEPRLCQDHIGDIPSPIRLRETESCTKPNSRSRMSCTLPISPNLISVPAVVLTKAKIRNIEEFSNPVSLPSHLTSNSKHQMRKPRFALRHKK